MIPFDLAKKMILDIMAGHNLDMQGQDTGFAPEVIEQFFKDEVLFSFDQFQKAAGVTGACMAPYYDNIFPLVPNFDLRAAIADKINTFGNIIGDAEVSVNTEGVWVNNNKINIAAYHTYDSSNEMGVLYLAANGFYSDSMGQLHELDVFHAEQVTEETFPLNAHSGNRQGDVEANNNAFALIFKSLPNDYRL